MAELVEANLPCCEDCLCIVIMGLSSLFTEQSGPITLVQSQVPFKVFRPGDECTSLDNGKGQVIQFL